MKQSIVILHGWGLSGARFADLAKKLSAEGYETHTPDFPGFGQSPSPAKPFFLKDYAEFLHGYLKAHRITHPILVGHSFGGRVSLKYNQMYPKSVRALILTGTPGFSSTNKKKLSLFIQIAKIGKAIFSIPPLSFLQEAVRRRYYWLVGAREYYKAQGAMKETFKNIVEEELVTPMSVVRVPTLLAWGEEDVITPIAVARRMLGAIPGAKLASIPGFGHGVPYKEPAVFVRAVLPFLKTL